MLEDAVRLLIETGREENEKLIADRKVVREPLVIDEPGWD
jgi:hypothetical protein